ncbi:MAG: methionyl-tRNA formyltransferase [Gemmatimonadetes bacterium]|nr:methionyl-tRNA formyltransferase [Gemmatimonadota bacterium]
MRVLFFGTPEFAVPSLKALVGEGFDVVGVVTRPDRPTGRHRSKATASPVKVAALAEDLPVLQPERPVTDEFLGQVGELVPDCSVVVAYGHLLPERLLAVPRLGAINVHASLLPALRGAAPIQRAILEGYAETGVTIMQMDAGLDTGPILHQVATPILPDETGGELGIRLSEIGAQALVEALTLMEETGLQPRPQNGERASYAPKLTREEERINWRRGAAEVARQIRALDPLPGAWAECRGGALKLFGARVREGAGRAGEVLGVGDALLVACAAGAVEVVEVQPAGRSRMSARAFVNGRRVEPGEMLS